MVGATVGSYRVVEKISAGGMGVVYRAEHVLIGRPAAVKILLPALSTDHDVVVRFFNEARATTQIRHPGIVEVFDFGFLDTGQAYLVMELLEGEPLSQRLKVRGRFSEADAAALMRCVCSAIGAAHARGVVHRDLKPDNIFLVPDLEIGERPKVLDFGIAKLAESEHSPPALTRTGILLGTPTYMSPEQCRGAGQVDHRADLYALGCILHELVCGRPPFVADGAGEIMGAHLFLAPALPRQHAPEISMEMENVILQLLAKRPEARLQSATELAGALAAIAGVAMPSAPPVPDAVAEIPAQRAATITGSSGRMPTGTSSSRRRRWLIGLSATLVLAAAGVSVMATGIHRSREIPAPVSTPVAVEPPGVEAQPAVAAAAPEVRSPDADAAVVAPDMGTARAPPTSVRRRSERRALNPPVKNHPSPADGGTPVPFEDDL